MWQAISEPRLHKSSNGEVTSYDVIGVARNDGFKVLQEKGGRFGSVGSFSCKGDFPEFYFSARRKGDEASDQPMKEYIIYLHTYDSQKDHEQVIKHANDIKQALINFPVSPLYKNIPVEDVVFEIGEPGNIRWLKAEDLQTA